MVSKKITKQFIELDEPEEVPDVKPKKVMSEVALANLAKARERAQERKTELKEINAKSKALK